MNKTPSKAKPYSMSLVARTESGRCEISLGLDELSPLDRKFLFDSLRGTQEGGSIGFDMMQTSHGEQKITLLLKAPNVDAAVHDALNH